MHARDLRLAKPEVVPVLDPGFQPAVLAHNAFQNAVADTEKPVPVNIALEQDAGLVSRFSINIFPEGHPEAAANSRFVERFIKCLLWSRGGHRITLSGSESLCQSLRHYYQETPTGKWDAEMMGDRIFERPFEIHRAAPEELPTEKQSTRPLGRHLEGCRVGFDLGGSDRKVAAVVDGKVIFSEEVVWDPIPQKDPQWHFEQIMALIKLAADKMPRVDAIGGSSAGVYANNRVKLASLFRGVSPELFKSRVANLFLELKEAWGSIPFELVNDGEVTALAGSMALNANGVLGIAMGTSMAAGYVNRSGNITSWLNELAFVPVDYNPQAAIDEWSKDRGCGVQYFSQQCVGRLIPKAGLDIDDDLSLPEKLKAVQVCMTKGDERAARIYETIGVYLGYTIAHLKTFYDFDHLLLLGRVTTGSGYDVMIREATQVLNTEFPDLATRGSFHVPDEKQKRHGQAIAAASLPLVKTNS